MTRLTLLLLPAAILAAPAAVYAQDWNDDGRVRGFERAPRVYWDGPCRVTQRINSDGELVERRRCRGDREAELRAARPDLDEPPRVYADEEPPRSYARRGDGYADRYREPPPPVERPRHEDEEPAPPVYREAPVQPAPVLRAPRIIAQSVPVAPPRPPVKVALAPAVKPAAVVAKPAQRIAARPVSRPAPVVVARAVPKPVAAPAPRVLARIAPSKPVRMAIAVKPAAKPAPVRVAAKAAPKRVAVARIEPPRVEPKPAPRIAARAQPAPKPAAKPVRMVAKVAPAPKVVARVVPAPKIAAAPARVVAKVAPLPKPVAAPARVVAKVAPLPKPAAEPARVVAKAAAPKVEVPAAVPAPAPKPAARPAVKSDWLVLLPAEEAKAEPETKAVPDIEKSEPLVQARVYAKGESYLQSRAYREYVLRKRSDPYSNLR